MVPPYVDDLSSSAGEEASQEAGGVWSAWSSIRATRAEEAASSGHDLPGPGGQRDEDEQRPEHAGAAGRDLPGRIVPDAGPSAGEPAESRATAGDVASGGAEASDNASEDEIAAADVAGDDRDGSGAAEPAAAADATQDGACVDGTADAGGTDETADRRAEAHEPGPGTAGPVTAEAKGERGEAGATEGALETERAGRPDHASASNRTEDNAGEDADHGAGHDGTPLDDEVTIVPGVARYHRRSCILIRFLGDGDLETTTRGDAEATGLVPCKACQPDKPGPSA
jgi:hypothetical protein